MYKKCKACGSAVANETRFCPVCGGSEFVVNNQANAQTAYNQPANSPWQPPTTQQKPKKKKACMIIGIIAAMVLLAGIGFVAKRAFKDQGNGDLSNDDYNIDASSSEEPPEKLYYSKGTFDGWVYENKWADIKFALPEGFSDADLAAYSAAESSNTECGMFFMADDTTSLIYICYEKLPIFPVYDEEEYLDSAMKSLQNASGVTYKIPESYTTKTIGGYSYAKAECEFNNGNGDFANTFYVRKLDGYMIVIAAISVDSASNDTLVENITTAK